MKMKYCPECGSIQLQFCDNGLKCKKCSYSGLMREDSIDVINSFIVAKKRHPVDSNSTSVFTPKNVLQSIPKTEKNNRNTETINNPVQEQKQVQANSNPIQTQTRSSFNSSVLMEQESKPDSLKERLKKLSSEHVEIL